MVRLVIYANGLINIKIVHLYFINQILIKQQGMQIPTNINVEINLKDKGI